MRRQGTEGPGGGERPLQPSPPYIENATESGAGRSGVFQADREATPGRAADAVLTGWRWGHVIEGQSGACGTASLDEYGQAGI
jgi:hypothetical protein